MPLNTLKLEQDIRNLQQELSTEQDPAAAAAKYAADLASIITLFVKSGTVTTTGTAAAQTGQIL